MRLWCIWWQVALLLAPLALASEETAIIEKYIRAYYIPGWGDSKTKFAQSLAKIGDVDGGGVTDIAAGTPYDGDDDDGRVVIMFLQTTGAWSAYNTISPSDLGIESGNKPRLGFGLARIDDRNRDGVVDLAVSSIGQRSSSPYPEGCVHLVHLTSNGEVTGTVRHLNGSFYGVTDRGADFGWAVAACGNWSDTGRGNWTSSDSGEHDLLVGAPGHEEPDRNGTGCVLLLVPALELDDPAASRVCAGDVSPEDAGAAAKGLGDSLAFLGGRRVAVGASSGGNSGEGALWLLTLNATMGVQKAVMLQTDGLLGLSGGDEFGAAVAVLSSIELEDGGECSSTESAGWDWDRNCDTLDLAVGAPKMDGISDDNDDDYYNSGVVFLITVDASNGVIVRHYALSNFDGVPYYSGGSISDLLGKRDYFGSSLACLGDLDSNGELELLAGAPGYSHSMNNNRGGGWITMFLQEPTPEPTLSPTLSAAPSTAPSPLPTQPPTLSPTTLATVGVDVKFTVTALAAPSANDVATLKTTVAAALVVGEDQLKRFVVESTSGGTVMPTRRLLEAVNWDVEFTVATELTADDTTLTDFGAKVESTLKNDTFTSSVSAAIANATVDTTSMTVVVLTRSPSMVPVSQPTPLPTSTPLPSKQPTLRPTPQPSREPSHTPTYSPTHADLPTLVPSHSPTPESTPRPSSSRIEADYGAASFTVLAWLFAIFFGLTFCYLSMKCAKALLESDPEDEDDDDGDDGEAAQRRRRAQAADRAARQRRLLAASIPTKPYEETKAYARAERDALFKKKGQERAGKSISNGDEAKDGLEKDACEAETCAICLADLEVADPCKELACGHCYHAPCLDEWLHRSKFCPLCKQAAAAAPGDGSNYSNEDRSSGAVANNRSRHGQTAAAAGAAVAPAPSDAWLSRFMSATSSNNGRNANQRTYDPDQQRQQGTWSSSSSRRANGQSRMDSTEFVAAEMEMAAVRRQGSSNMSSSTSSSSSSSSSDSLSLRNYTNTATSPSSPISMHLPPPPPGVKRVSFEQGPMGITVMTTPDEGSDTTSLVVTNVQVCRQGWRGGVRAGHVVVELNGNLLESGLSNDAFRVEVAALPRPVILGFRRPPVSSTSPPRGSNLDRSIGCSDNGRFGQEVPPPSAPPRESEGAGGEADFFPVAVDRTPALPATILSSTLLPLDSSDHEHNTSFLRVSEVNNDDEDELGRNVLEAFVVVSSSASSVSSGSSSSRSSSGRTSDPSGTDRLHRLQQRLRTRSHSDEHLFAQAGAAFGRSPGNSAVLSNHQDEEEAWAIPANSTSRNNQPSRLYEAML